MHADREFEIRDAAKPAPYRDEYDVVAGCRMCRRDQLPHAIPSSTFN